jgi:alkanesulfonate monooxygenase SsuD/methylene tetrahydromethanopterin reductase-like flavin-dependent oxidoreductase (luciferase family)
MHVGSFVLAAQFPGQGQGEALHRAVRSAEVAEEAGLDAVWLAEHHFVPYGTCPSAITLAALLLGRTRRIRVGTAVSVLPTAHPVALGEQAALLHMTSGGRFSLGVGRGGPWVDLEVFGSGLQAYETGFPESLDLLVRWLREPAVGADGERFRFREVPVVPRPSESLTEADGPEVIVACTSPASVRLAAERGLPMLLGMHVGDEEKAEMVALWRRQARAAGHTPEKVLDAPHVSAGVCQIRWPTPNCSAGCTRWGPRGCAPTASRRPANGRVSPASPCSSRAREIWRPPRRTYGGWVRKCCRI